MDYSKLSDQEINILTMAYAMPKTEIFPHPHNHTAAAYEYWPGEFRCLMPVQRAEDGYDIARKNRIAIIPHGKTRWMAYHENGMSYTDRKPLRAAMIVYLMMQEGK